MKWSQVLDDWKNGINLPSNGNRDTAYLWRTSPISSKRDLTFKESRIIDTNLHKKGNNPNNSLFLSKPIELLSSKHTNKYVVHGPNLSKDCYLVIPKPINGVNCANLFTFLNTSSNTQIKAVWKRVAEVANFLLDRYDYIWISTHGHGVNWLHIRISIKPKYYGDSKLQEIPL